MKGRRGCLLVILVLIGVAGSSGVTLTTTLDATGTATTVGRGEGKVNVLLGLETDDEGGDVDDLLADTDVLLTDENTGVVDGLGETELEDLGLEATLEEILNLKTEDVIKLGLGLVEDTDANETTDQGVTLEETTGVLGVKGEEVTGSTTDVGQGVGHTPDLALVTETKLTDELELLIDALGLEGATGHLVGLGVYYGKEGKKGGWGGKAPFSAGRTGTKCIHPPWP